MYDMNRGACELRKNSRHIMSPSLSGHQFNFKERISTDGFLKNDYGSQQ